MRIAVEINQSQLKAATAALADIRGGIHRAIQGAIGEVLNGVKTDVSSAIREKVNIKKKILEEKKRKYIIVKRSKLSGAVIVPEAARIPLKHFGARQTASGVSYKVRGGGTVSRIAGAFGPNIEKLNKHVFRRTGHFKIAKRGRYVGKKRETLAGALKGPSPWGAIVQNELSPEIQEKANKRLARELDERVTFLVKKANGLI